MGAREVRFSKEKNSTMYTTNGNFSWAYVVLWRNHKDDSGMFFQKTVILYPNINQSLYLGFPKERIMILDIEEEFTRSDSGLNYHQLPVQLIK